LDDGVAGLGWQGGGVGDGKLKKADTRAVGHVTRRVRQLKRKQA